MAHGVKLKDEATGAIISALQNINSAPRQYTLKDRDGIIVDQDDADALQAGVDSKRALSPAIISVTGDYVLSATDIGKMLQLNISGTNSLTFADDAAIPVGAEGEGYLNDSGTVLLTADTGITVTFSGGGTLAPGESIAFIIQGNAFAWKKVSAAEYFVVLGGINNTGNNLFLFYNFF